ncbi:MAG: hypothetical protein QOC67_1249 [Pseudonocardiales bacterium]|nr:hypothetical protein [Pseudonocardiales bacterium]
MVTGPSALGTSVSQSVSVAGTGGRRSVAGCASNQCAVRISDSSRSQVPPDSAWRRNPSNAAAAHR